MGKIRKILVSQPRPTAADKSPYSELGVEVDYRPLIRVEGVSLKEFRSQRVEILQHTAVIFTSRTTIDHFFRIVAEARVAVPDTMKYICNTEATALYLQKHIIYRKRKIFFADGSFKGLMELIMKHKEENFLLVLSEPHKPELPETLERLGLKFDKVILSRTVSADLDDVDWSQYDMAVLFSPSEVTSLARIEKKLPLIATFGEGTTRKALECGLLVGLMAPTPAAPSMAKAIALYMKAIETGTYPEPIKLNYGNEADDFVRSQQARASRKRAVPK